MPFLWEPLPPSTSSFSQAGSGIHAAASFHSPLRVVRISRRSGNFDSTACRSGLQVTLVSSLFRSRAGNPVCQPVPALPKLCRPKLCPARAETIPPPRPALQTLLPSAPDAQNAAPSGAALCVYRAGHWPPNFLAGGLSTVPLQAFPAGLSLNWGRLWADALAGCLSLSGLAWIDSSSRYITGTL